MNPIDLNGDAVVACADIVGRAGASAFEIGYLHDDVPAEDANWYATASYIGGRIMTDGHRSPSLAAMALAERILRGGTCRCRHPVTLTDGPGCRWTLVGKRWQPGCDGPPLRVAGKRGDIGALRAAVAEPSNQRRPPAVGA